jgi:hypothetical protein
MHERRDDDAKQEGAGAIAATVMALAVLVAIIVLFLLLKFNLFNGGKPANLPTTAPAPHTVVLPV